MATKALQAVVVGSSTLLGKELIDEISTSAASVWELKLLDESEEMEGQLTAAGEEALIVHALTEEALLGADLVFFAGEPTVAAGFWEAAVRNGAAVVDLTGALVGKPGFILRSPWIAGSARPDLTTAGAVGPHPAALMLALVADRLRGRFGVDLIAATVLEPASQAGSAGVDELHQQTVNLLSFQELPKDVFDAQVAFNLQGQLGEESRVRLTEMRETIRRETLAILGPEFRGGLSINLLQAPVFHGYLLSVFVRLASPATEDQLRSELRGGVLIADPDTVPSNQLATETGEMLLSVQMDDEQGSQHWLVLAADNFRIAAHNAVEAALELAALRPGERVQ